MADFKEESENLKQTEKRQSEPVEVRATGYRHEKRAMRAPTMDDAEKELLHKYGVELGVQ